MVIINKYWLPDCTRKNTCHGSIVQNLAIQIRTLSEQVSQVIFKKTELLEKQNLHHRTNHLFMDGPYKCEKVIVLWEQKY